MLASPVPRETLLHVMKALPAAPLILSQLGRLLLNLNSDLDDITRLLRCDLALTTRIIRIGNSAAYNVAAPYATLEQALARVGFTEVYRVVGLAVAAQVADRDLPLYGVTGRQIRENALLTALIMEELADAAGLDSRAAYTAGLLRSIGKIALDRLTQDPCYRGTYPAERGWPLAEWERGFAGLSNCEAAAFVLHEWRFSQPTIAGIYDHYLPGPSSSALARLLNLAAGAAGRCGHLLPGEQPYWKPLAEKFAGAGVSPHEVDASVEAALVRFERLRAALG